MVFKLQLRLRRRHPLVALAGATAFLVVLLVAYDGALPRPARADQPASARAYLNDAQEFYKSGQYFKAARYSFAANEMAEETGEKLGPESYAWITVSLVKANLNNSASYFFIRTLQTGDKTAIRKVLQVTEDLLVQVGDDLLRTYLIRHTAYEDYDAMNRSGFLYSLGKSSLLGGQADKAIGYLSAVANASPLRPYALQLRGAANAILGNGDAAIRDFHECASRSGDVIRRRGMTPARVRQFEREADDLKARCLAGEARTLYQMERFEEADRAYDHIAKASLVWPDILFEHAWNSYARGEYNRTLGKLVTYKSPALRFVFNSEIDVLRAQAYLALCLYEDANVVVNEFNARYAKVGEYVKRFVESNANDLDAFYNFGKEALAASLYTDNDAYRMADRFIRGPYFQDMVFAEREVASESDAIRRFDLLQPGVAHKYGQGFPGFLHQVLSWRLKTIRLFGGTFVKNSLISYHGTLLADFEKMAFIKLELLKRAKEQLLNRPVSTLDRSRGNVKPRRRDDQFYWSFNGEFWNDELGDYVFGLESACK